MSERYGTHSLGVMCAICYKILEPPDCACGTKHGYGHQKPSAWAARAWPDHPCFTGVNDE